MAPPSETIASTRSGGWGLQDVALDDLDDVRKPVRGGQLLREDRDRRLFHCVDACCTCLRREQAQDAASRPDVENDVAGAHDRVDRLPECLGANAVADHRPVDFELGVHRVRRVFDRRSHPPTVNDPPESYLDAGSECRSSGSTAGDRRLSVACNPVAHARRPCSGTNRTRDGRMVRHTFTVSHATNVAAADDSPFRDEDGFSRRVRRFRSD